MSVRHVEAASAPGYCGSLRDVIVRPAASGGKARRIAQMLASLSVGMALACATAELTAGPGYRLGWWRLGPAFGTLRWAVIVDLAAIVIALTAAILAYNVGTRRTLLVSLVGLVVSIAVAAPPVYLWRQAEALPHIHDISTDTNDPPRFVAIVPLRKDARNSIDYRADTAALQRKGYPDIGPIVLSVPPAHALQLAERASRAMGWDIVAVAPADLRLEAIDTTPMFGFKDDIVIRVTASGSGSRVDARSLSRIGNSDLGMNAKRIRLFMRELEAAQAK
jgi:uncharacterized protein (DUF1499 family)